MTHQAHDPFFFCGALHLQCCPRKKSVEFFENAIFELFIFFFMLHFFNRRKKSGFADPLSFQSLIINA